MKKMLALAAAALVSACNGSDKNDVLPGPGEPNDTIETATPFTPGTPMVATISQGYDYDFYKFTLTNPATVRFQTFDQTGAGCGNDQNMVDTVVDVYDSSQTKIAFADDTYDNNGSFVNFCEDFTVPMPAGQNYVSVSGIPPYPFNYTLKITVQ